MLKSNTLDVYYHKYTKIKIISDDDLTLEMHQRSVLFCTIHIFRYRIEFQSSVCNGCHVVLMISIELNSIPVSNINNIGYHCVIYEISKIEAIFFIKKILISVKKVEHYKKWISFSK